MKLTAAITIRGDADTVWRRTRDTVQHARWDLRFTKIDAEPPDGGVRLSTVYDYRVRYGLPGRLRLYGGKVRLRRRL